MVGNFATEQRQTHFKYLWQSQARSGLKLATCMQHAAVAMTAITIARRSQQ